MRSISHKFRAFLIFFGIFFSGCVIEVIQDKIDSFVLEPDSTWQVYKIIYHRDESTHIIDKFKITMRFDMEQDRIYGINVCNNYFATFELDDMKLAISDAGSSRRECYPRESGRVAFMFISSLNGDFVVKDKGDELELIGEKATYFLKRQIEIQ